MTDRISGSNCTIINTPYVKTLSLRASRIEKYFFKNKYLKKYFRAFRWLKGTKMFKQSALEMTYKTVWCAGPSLEGVKSISFKTGENHNFVEIEMENEKELISFDYDSFIRNSLKTHLPFTRSRRSVILPKSSLRYKKNKKIASIGSWLNENEFQLTNYLYETPVKMTYDFIFSDDGLIVKSIAKNYLGVSNKELILKSIRYE